MDDIQSQLNKALEECARIRDENARLRKRLGMAPSNPPAASLRQNKPSRLITNDSPAEIKIKLFRSLFRGREDVYAVRWEGKNGKSGYSPACANEWNKKYCRKPKVKCSRCDNRELLSVTDEVVHDHLMGKQTIGVYPLLSDERTWFLSADFDKASWQEDVGEFLATCTEMGIPAALERSRSGGGGHVWIFFQEPIPAIQARRLGSVLLTHVMDRRHQIGLDSYDRLFPNQDTMPKGGFGNLIALPLQRGPREKGNSLFLDRDLEPYSDQWEYLCRLKRVALGQVDSIVNEAVRSGKVMGVRMSLTEQEGDQDPWESSPSGKRIEEPLDGHLPKKLCIVVGNMIYVEKQALPPAMMNRLMRLAAFQNPEFYKAQAMRLSTFGKPRVISCSEDFPKHIGLPRGCWNDFLNLLNTHHIKEEVKDERFTGFPINVVFRGELCPLQQEAVHALMPHDNGILSAATAFGKTIV
ncbi:MAG: restriction endonuclease subunit R, partial [bacterium]